MKNKPIYVEIPIQTEIEKLWEATQNPKLHEQWDLRFSNITYLEKENGQQLFSYKTKIGFGLEIKGWGKNVGSYNSQGGSRISSLHFGTDNPISIISEGKGYWKYKPEHEAITFITQYDYQTRFWMLGKWVDRILFRPLLGWGTALSFDTLKRWLEKGETPASQYVRFFTHWMVTFLLFFVWVYHGLIPKVIFKHPEELAMLQRLAPLSHHVALRYVTIIGIAEVVFGFLILFFRKKRPLFLLQIIAFPILTIAAIVADSSYLTHPFNPLTFNLALWVLAIIGYAVGKDVPSAISCKRKRKGAD